MMGLCWKHHALIQALLTRGPLPEKEFHKIFTGVTGKNPGSNQQYFNEYLLKINKELSLVQFELRGCRNQYDGQICYGFINIVSDDQSKLGTNYSLPQIAFFKGIIEEIVRDGSAEGSISCLNALNIRLDNQAVTGTGSRSLGSQSQSQGSPLRVPPAFRNFSLSQKEKTLHELVRDKWLCYTQDSNIGLGVRSFLDLRSWFRSADVPSCEVCNEAGIKAQTCQNEGCAVRIHQYCQKKKFSKRGVEKVCPSCGTRWLYPSPQVETTEEDDELNEPSQTQPLPPSTQSQSPQRLKRKRLATNVADIVGCSSSQASLHASDMRRTRSSARQR
ncbi:SMC_Nse1 domain-containing protein/zf-RING-like domain-containing protein, partial [Cephalotus follicularis]